MASRSLGDLFVSLSLKSESFSKGVADAADKVEGLASKAAAAIGDISGGFAALGGVAAGALALAATGADGLAGVSSRAKAETERLQRATTLLAVEVSEVLLPAVRAMTDGVLRLVGMWRSLDEGTRKNIGSMLGWAAAIGAGLAATSKGLVIFKGFFELAVVLAPAIGAMIVPLLAVAAAMAGVLLLAGALRAAGKRTTDEWLEGLGNLWKAYTSFVSSMLELYEFAAEDIRDAFVSAFRGVVGAARAAFAVIVEGALLAAKTMGRVMAPLARGTGQNQIASMWESIQVMNSDGILKAFDEGVAAMERGARKYVSALPGELAAGAFKAAMGPLGAVIDPSMLATDFKKALAGSKEILGDAYAPLERLFAQFLDGIKGFGAAKTPGVPGDAVAMGKSGDQLEKVATRKWQGIRAGFDRFADEVDRMNKEMEESAKRARESLVSRAIGALGDLGSIISNAAQAAAGGPWAVAASVAMDLLTRSEGFKALVEVLNGIVGTVADALGVLFVALRPVVGALGVIITAVVDTLQPVLNVVANVLQSFAPPLMVVGNLLRALAPVLQILAQVVMMVTMPLTMLAGPILKALFEVLKFVSVVILTVVRAVGSVWNTILDAVLFVLRALDSLPFVDLGGVIETVKGMKMDTAALGEQIQGMKDMEWDDSMRDAGDAADSFTKAATKAGQEMLNVPAIWKRALRAGQAMDPQASPLLPPGSAGAQAPASPPPGTSTQINIIGYDIDEATEQAMRMQEFERQRLSGRDGGNPNRSARLVSP